MDFNHFILLIFLCTYEYNKNFIFYTLFKIIKPVIFVLSMKKLTGIDTLIIEMKTFCNLFIWNLYFSNNIKV